MRTSTRQVYTIVSVTDPDLHEVYFDPPGGPTTYFYVRDSFLVEDLEKSRDQTKHFVRSLENINPTDPRKTPLMHLLAEQMFFSQALQILLILMRDGEESVPEHGWAYLETFIREEMANGNEVYGI